MSKTNIPSISVRVNRLSNDPNSNIRAMCSATVGDSFAIHGIRVIDSSKGRFVAMPGYSFKDTEGNTKYADYFHAVTKEAREALNKEVLDAYENAIQQAQDASEAETEELIDDVSDGLTQSM